MPEITELRAGDPAEVAGYRLSGRLAPGVFAGRSRAGEPVLVRLLPAEVDPEAFLREMEPLRAVSAVGTAQVLDAGVQGEQAYLVAEWVDGPSLAEVGGSADGVGLHRLAAGTITALVALHQAGLVHGDIRPGNVLLGPDGPRVADAGLEHAMAQASVSTRKVAVPAYTAPERLAGGAATPAGDVFSWAATMVFAVSGASPFEGGSMAATVARITGGQADLPELGELHGLIVACLEQDPEARPAASEVLLRLVGQTSLLTGRVDSGAVAAAPPPRRGRSVLALAAAFVAGALVSAAGFQVLSGGPATRSTAATAATPTSAVTPAPGAAPTPTITTVQTEAPSDDVEKKGLSDTKLKDVAVTLHEHADDSMRLVSYLGSGGQFSSFARPPGGEFKEVGNYEQPALSPGGDWVALNPMLKFQTSELDQIRFVRMSTGESFVVSTVKKPLQTLTPVWSRDGGKLLLSVYNQDKDRRLVGFVVIELATRKAVHVETEYTDNSSLYYNFAPDGTVVRGFWDGKNSGIEFYDMSGQVTKTMHWVGLPRGGEWFSPSGKRLATVCPNGKELCVWDLATGARQATVDFGDAKGSFLGWFNEKHLMVQDPGKKKTQQIQIIDFIGDVKRVLADLATDGPVLLQFARVPRS
ncbi:serine/threonine-protein kinase [Nonomuraea sp. NPDC048882]|uniref:serine/threonine-protein kinase n=1 Tax=unclassified Nonomuraea TaxID=2593643 RepID=UPI0034048D32